MMELPYVYSEVFALLYYFVYVYIKTMSSNYTLSWEEYWYLKQLQAFLLRMLQHAYYEYIKCSANFS